MRTAGNAFCISPCPPCSPWFIGWEVCNGRMRIVDVERIVVDVPFTPRCQQWNAREVWQWRISEIIRVTTDAPDIVGYGETILHYTWGRVSDEAIARVKGKNPSECLGDDSLGAGLQMALYDVVGKAQGVPILSPVQPAPHTRMVSHQLVEHRHAARRVCRGSKETRWRRATRPTRSRRGPGGMCTNRWHRSAR